MSRRELAVALHDVEPGTYERCATIREWLGERGVDRLTLLVVPAADLHPFHRREPQMAAWLRDRVASGDGVAQHGLRHRRTRGAPGPHEWFAGLQGPFGSAEFVGLGAAETSAAVRAGRRIMTAAGIKPEGFVAPAYAYTPALRRELAEGYSWWAGLLHVHTSRPGRGMFSPAVSLGGSTALRRTLSPGWARISARAPGSVLRLDVHPSDFDHPSHLAALETILRGASRQRAVTYGELLA